MVVSVGKMFNLTNKTYDTFKTQKRLEISEFSKRMSSKEGEVSQLFEAYFINEKGETILSSSQGCKR